MSNPRYARLDQIEWWDRNRLREARALVAGAGALGNELIKNLLLLGWGTIIVIDLDRVEASNLSRSIMFREADVGEWKATAIADSAAKVNPDCTVIGLAGDVRLLASAGLLARVDVAFGCLDNLAARVGVAQLAGRPGCLVIDGGLTTWEGTVRCFLPPDGPCYMCGLTDDDLRELTLRRSCLAYARRSLAAAGIATTPTLASVIAAAQVQQALKWIHRDKHSFELAIGSELRFDLAYDRFWKSAIPQNPECLLHPETVTPDAAPTLSWELSWASAVSLSRDHLGIADLDFYLPLQVLERSRCPACGHESQAPRAHLGDLAVDCDHCGSAVIADLTNVVTGAESWAGPQGSPHGKRIRSDARPQRRELAHQLHYPRNAANLV